MRVRVNSVYVFRPALIDRIDPPHGVQTGKLKSGDRVRVVNIHGCPPANTMGQCYINSMGGDFLGMVSTASLDKE